MNGRRGGRLAEERRGGALVLALIVVAFVTAFALATMRVSGSVTQRQTHATNDKRAFYLAEAGLSEAYYGLQTGKNGQVGSLAQPARLADGLVWVDSTWGEDGLVTLRSTGLCESGRSTLELVVRRETQPFGIFADEGIDLAVPFLLDGYDSETTTYHEQAGLNVVVIPPDAVDWKFSRVQGEREGGEVELDDGGSILGYLLYYGGAYYAVETFDLDARIFHWTAQSTSSTDVQKYLMDGKLHGSLVLADTGGDPELSDGSGAPVLYDPSATASTYDDHTTGVGGELGSNGPISLATTGTDPIVIHGDLVPGPGAAVSVGAGVGIAGSTDPRAEALILPPVTAPDLELLPGVTHSSSIPYVLPPGEIGYEHVRVTPGAELVMQGPSELVIGELLLEQDAILVVENDTGAVNLYVTGFVDFDPGSVVQVASQDTADLSLQGTPTALDFTLDATSQFHGMIYAPDAHVYVGSAFEIFGMLASNTLDVAPYARLHFDSGVLGDSGAVPIPRLVGWSIQEIPAAVAQSRVDPFELLDLVMEDLPPASDAQGTVSWILECNYMSQETGTLAHYKGPFELLDKRDVEYFDGPKTLTAPTVEFSAPWTIDIDYDDWSDTKIRFNGSLAEFAANHLDQLMDIERDFKFTPPPELQ